MNIVHISECPSLQTSGMGRIQFHWNQELRNRGHEVVSIEPPQLGKISHPALFPFAANSYYKKNGISPDIIVAHEPVSGMFVKKGKPVFLVSHGIEARNWELSLKGKIPNPNALNLKTRLLFPLWRLYWCELGIRKSYKLLLSNTEDADYVQVKYKRKANDIMVFLNGYYPELIQERILENKTPVILWNSSWIERKGKDVFLDALMMLHARGIKFEVLIAGTGYDRSIVLEQIPNELKHTVQVISHFDFEKEKELLTKANIFVLASYFEGLPLSLVQSMAGGLCCIASNNCGQRDIIRHSENGLLFSTGNAQDLAFNLEKVILDRVLMKNLGSNASLTIQPCTWEVVSKEVADFVLTS